MRSKRTVVCRVFLTVMVWIGIVANASAAPQDGYNLTASLWAKAVLQVPGSPVTLVWRLVGTDITPSGAQVVSGYFYADPADFAYGSQYNPEVFVKVYIAPNGWANIAFNHVTVDDVVVYSSHGYTGTADQTGTISLSSRLTEHQYNGVAIDGSLVQSSKASGTITRLSSNDDGAAINSGLWAKAVLQAGTGPVTLVWKTIGSDTTSTGDRVVSGYFYADPADFAYGSEFNPEVFVKIYIAASGWANMAFNHVTVDGVSLSSAHNYAGSAQRTDAATLTGRLVQHQYEGVVISDDVALADIEGVWLARMATAGGDPAGSEQLWGFALSGDELDYVGEKDGLVVGSPVSVDGTEIAFSYDSPARTVTPTGKVAKDLMSGTWIDNAGGSGIWEAGNDIRVKGAQTTIYDEGDILMVMEQDGGGTATFYGSVAPETEKPTFTRIICETQQGDLTLTLNTADQLTGLSIGMVDLTVTYNPDESFNIKLLSDGQTVLDESNLKSQSLQSLARQSAFKGLPSGIQALAGVLAAAASEGSEFSYEFRYLAGKWSEIFDWKTQYDFKTKLAKEGVTVPESFKRYLQDRQEYLEIVRSSGVIASLLTYRLAAIKNECNDPGVILMEANKEACERNYQKAVTVFDSYERLLKQVADLVVEKAWEDFVTDLVGTFKGTNTVSVWGCEDGTNITLGGSMTIKIDSNSDGAFSGTFTGVLPIGVEQGTINGTIDNYGNVSGTTSHTCDDTAGTGTFSGTYDYETGKLDITNDGHDTSGDTCSYRRIIKTTKT